MMPLQALDFPEVWCIDFEFSAPRGEHPDPLCLVARELRSGEEIRLWRDQLHELRQPPYPVGPDSLIVAYFASAEVGCHRALGWPAPARVLDLYTEFRNQTNGAGALHGNGLLGALAHFGLPGIEALDKDDMRELAMRGGPYTADERQALIDYCATDVDALARLLPRMLPDIDLPRAMLRGRYMSAVARMEWNGVPIDVEVLDRLRARWEEIQLRVIEQIDGQYGVFDGTTFKVDRWESWLVDNGIPWPLLESGRLRLDDVTFRDMALTYPTVAPMRELRATLSAMRLERLAVGSDGRNRCLLSPFRARTGRNAPSNTAFIFGPAVWLRSLIRPPAGRGLAYVDWSQQEFGIAAALAGDRPMMNAYESGDPYLAFAVQAGAAPPDATKETHRAIREQFKACALAVQYGMGAESLALRIGVPTARARTLLALHRETFQDFWRFSDAALDHAMLRGWLPTVFGWTVRVGTKVNPRSLRNYPMQANGAEMLRLACTFATEQGIEVVAPVHDALLIEAPVEDLDVVVEQTRACMARASRIVLDGFELRTDVDVVRYPDRYRDPRGAAMWELVTGLLGIDA
jgi:DNA polymerase I